MVARRSTCLPDCLLNVSLSKRAVIFAVSSAFDRRASSIKGIGQPSRQSRSRDSISLTHHAASEICECGSFLLSHSIDLLGP